MEYSLVEGKKLNSTNYESEGFRYVKSRECETTIYLKYALFRTHSCLSIGRIDKITNQFEVTRVHSGFCKTCANRLWEMKATCPICRNTIKGVLRIFQ